MLLFSSVILTRTCDVQTQHIAIKFQTRFSVADYNRRMVNAEKQTISSLPFRIALSFRELQDLKPVFVGIAKIKCLYAAGILVPVRQTLRTCRGMLDFVLAQQCVGLVHVAGDDRN